MARTLTLTNDGHGTITVDAADLTDVAVGSLVTITLAPASGYEFDKFNVTGNVIIQSNKFVMPDQDCTIDVDFKLSTPTTYKVLEEGFIRVNEKELNFHKNMKLTVNQYSGLPNGYALNGSGATIDSTLAAYLLANGMIEQV